MCWNAEVSIQTFLFALFSFILGYNYGFPIKKLLFFMLFSSIQLVEFFLWKYLNNKKYNVIFSKIGLFLILLEPIGLLNIMDNQLIRFNSILIYTLITILFLFLNYKNINFITTIAKNGHLNWKWLDNISNKNIYSYYYILWIIFMFFGGIMTKDIFIIFIGLFTFIISMYNNFKYESHGSFWCSIGNILWLYVIIWILVKNFKN